MAYFTYCYNIWNLFKLISIFWICVNCPCYAIFEICQTIANNMHHQTIHSAVTPLLCLSRLRVVYNTIFKGKKLVNCFRKITFDCLMISESTGETNAEFIINDQLTL